MKLSRGRTAADWSAHARLCLQLSAISPCCFRRQCCNTCRLSSNNRTTSIVQSPEHLSESDLVSGRHFTAGLSDCGGRVREHAEAGVQNSLPESRSEDLHDLAKDAETRGKSQRPPDDRLSDEVAGFFRRHGGDVLVEFGWRGRKSG